MLRQWFGALLRRFDYMTIKVVGEGGGYSHQPFQLLDLERRSLIVRPFVDLDDAAQLEGLYSVSIQALEVWNPSGSAELGSTLDTFVFHDPSKVDIITACGCSLNARQDIHVWEPRGSDVDGCVELHNCQRLTSRRVDPLGAQAPVLSILDALSERGLAGVDEAVLHEPGCARFDQRHAISRRAYLQCVLRTDELAAKGIKQFRSVGSNAYFLALLHGKGDVRPGLSAKEYRKMLAEDRGDELALAAIDAGERQLPPLKDRLSVPSHAPATAPARAPLLGEDDEASSDSSSVVGGPPDLADEHGAKNNAASESGNSVVGPVDDDNIEAPPPRERLGEPGCPIELCGVKVLFVPGRSTETHTYSDRLSVACCNPAHHKCSKSRSLALHKGKLGVRCAEAFLGVWLTKAYSMTGQAHAKYMPAVEEMQQWLTENP